MAQPEARRALVEGGGQIDVASPATTTGDGLQPLAPVGAAVAWVTTIVRGVRLGEQPAGEVERECG